MTKTQKREVAIYLRMHNQLSAGVRQAELTLGSFRRRVNRDFVRLGAAMTAAVAGALIATAAAGADFEQSMANVGSVARATAAEMAALEERALSLGESTAFTASQVADSMYSLASGGMDTAQIIASTEGVLKLAGATMSDMGMAAEITMATLRQFDIAAEDTSRVVNVFGAGIQNSMLNLERLGLSMSYVGPVAKAMNIDLETTVGTLAALHNAGLLGMKAGTGLRAVLLKLADPSKELKAVLGGLTVEEDGLPAVAQALQDAGLSAGQMAQMFGQEAVPAVKALADAGAADLGKLTKAVTDTNASFDMYAIQMNTTKGLFKQISSAIEGTMLRAFAQIGPVVNDAQRAVLDWINRSRAGIVRMVKDAVLVVLDLVDAIGRLTTWIVENSDMMLDFAKTVGVVTAAVYGLSVVFGVVNTLMAVTPLGAVITLVGALAVGIAFLVERMGGWKVAWIELKRIFAINVEYMKWSWNAVVQDFKNFSHTADAMKKTFSILLTALKDGFEAFRGRFSVSWSTLWAVIMDPKQIGRLATMGDVWEGFGREMSSSLGAGVQSEIVAAWKEAADLSNAASQEVYDVYVKRANQIDSHYREQIEAIKAGGDSLDLGFIGLDERDWDFTRGWPEYMDSVAAATEEVEKLSDATATAGTAPAGDAGRYFDSIASAARGAANSIGDDLVNALFDAKAVMIDLESVAKNLLGTLLSAGISSLLGGIGPAGGFFDRVWGGNNALGGYAFAGNIYGVNERDQEFFIPATNGRITPIGPAQGQGGGAREVHHHHRVEQHVNIPKGSLIIAEDDMAVRRWGRAFLSANEEGVNRTFRG